MTRDIWIALLAEFIGTFLLVFIGASAVSLTTTQGGSVLATAFAFGLALAALIYIWGTYSGAHFNPAVSFGFAVAGQMNWLAMLGYWLVQFIAAIAAGGLVAYFFGTATGAGATTGVFTYTDAWKTIFFEALLTFFLVIAYLFLYKNPFYALISGIAIGITLTACIIAGSYGTGASLNPARSVGTGIFGNAGGSIWLYIVGPLLGALVAALVYRLLTIDFTCCDKTDDCGNVIKDECGNPLKECCRPKVDNCGNVVKDCHGEIEYDTYTKHERKLTHMQETPLMAVGQWMSSHGFDPRYLRQEVGHVVDKVLPNGVVENPPAVVESIVQSVVPTSLPKEVAQVPVTQTTKPQLTPDQMFSQPNYTQTTSNNLPNYKPTSYSAPTTPGFSSIFTPPSNQSMIPTIPQLTTQTGVNIPAI